MLLDDVAVHGHDEALWGSNPRLAGFFRAYLAQPAVLGWCRAGRLVLYDSYCHDGAAAAVLQV